MKKGFKISLLILSLSLLLTACNGGETVTENAAVSIAESTTEKNVESNDTEKDVEGINLNDDWYTKNLWYRGTYNTKNIIHIKEDSHNKGEYWLCAAFSVICRFYPDSASEITAENLGQGIRYVYDDGSYRIVLDYFPDTNQILLVMPLGSPHTGTKYDYSDLYEYDNELTESQNRLISNSPTESPDDEENIDDNYSYQAHRYECFETSGGWDAEIDIYYSNTDESIEVDIVRIAGGNLSLENGVYSGYWEDFDSQVSLIITENSPEITFTATGELEQYSGTYIQLPDLGTDGEN